MTTFLESHPWIKFDHPLERANVSLWLLLGEARSKCEHLSWVPLAPDVREHLYGVYLAKGVLATTAIEGNTLSEEDVKRHLEGTLKLPPSQEYLAKEIDNIIDACNAILGRISRGDVPEITSACIRYYNRQVLDGLSFEQDVVPGEVRNHSVGVARYKAPPATEAAGLLDKLCEWLNGETFCPPSDDMKVVCGILKAIFAHLYIAWIHPFGDGNGRTARLLEFQILVEAGVPAPAAHLLSDHYNRTRTEYYRQLDRSSRSGGDVIPFLMYALQGFVDGLREQLFEIREQVMETTWENYVHGKFHHMNSPSDVRRRHLVLDLTRHGAPASITEAREITPRLAAAYANKTLRTIQRDFGILQAMGLVVQQRGKYRVRREEVLMWRPFTHQPPPAAVEAPEDSAARQRVAS